MSASVLIWGNFDHSTCDQTGASVDVYTTVIIRDELAMRRRRHGAGTSMVVVIVVVVRYVCRRRRRLFSVQWHLLSLCVKLGFVFHAFSLLLWHSTKLHRWQHHTAFTHTLTPLLLLLLLSTCILTTRHINKWVMLAVVLGYGLLVCWIDSFS